MILIADSGSTKCDWTLIQNGAIVGEFSTMGFNPFYHSPEAIAKGVYSHPQLVKIKDEIQLIRYLGAGCSEKEKRAIVHEGLSQIFRNAEIVVEHDLLGAAYATYSGAPNITGILGTGSNACFFDGIDLIQKTPSLGFVMGDEGSGGFFGKKLVQAHCYGWLKKEISKDFESTYKYTIPQLIHRVNSEPHTNVFLAGFMPFVCKYQSDDFISDLLRSGMKEYFFTHILPLQSNGNVPVNFIGSVGFYFKDVIKETAHALDMECGEFVQKPSSRIVKYFLDFVL